MPNVKKAVVWADADFEEAECFRCRVRGELLFRRPPFGVVRCPTCGQVFISPRLNAQGRKKIYDDADYFDVGVYGGPTGKLNLAFYWPKRRAALVRSQVRTAQPRLLEIGCAYGVFLEAAQRAGFEVSGIELSKPAASYAREHLKAEVVQGELESTPLPDAGFDAVCGWDVLEHVLNPLSFMQTVARVLRPGGVVALSVPYFSSLPARLFRSRWWTLRPEQHIWHFTPDTLRRLFADAGLTPRRMVVSPFAPVNLTRLDSLVALATKD